MTYDLYSDCVRRAAKPHRCDECRHEIAKGSRYKAWFQLFEGTAYSGHICLKCDAMRALAWEVFDWCDPEEAAPCGDLRGFLAENYETLDADAWFSAWEIDPTASPRIRGIFADYHALVEEPRKVSEEIKA